MCFMREAPPAVTVLSSVITNGVFVRTPLNVALCEENESKYCVFELNFEKDCDKMILLTKRMFVK